MSGSRTRWCGWLGGACAGLALAGCGGPPLGPIPSRAEVAADDSLLFVRPYRGPDDTCQLTGETAFTAPYLDDGLDLVSCPTGSADAGTVLTETGATQVTETDDYTLFSVPRT